MPKGSETELTASAKLYQLRAGQPKFRDISFDTIAAYADHAAIVHYEPTAETDVPLEPRSFCLADTGGHYLQGTTDITRTIPLGPLTEEERRAYTVVLKGHLRLGAARFPEGLCGQNLDILARLPLWEQGMDYNHGTGHGVGYVLSVHEGPQRLHWRLPENQKVTALAVLPATRKASSSASNNCTVVSGVSQAGSAARQVKQPRSRPWGMSFPTQPQIKATALPCSALTKVYS